ncbi:replication factor C subunit 2/4 [Mytilus galloprovincialis]|nr:replication factor C subunit 2/4 [Mytilus galloprovincialis]
MGCCFSSENGLEPSSTSSLLSGPQRKYVDNTGPPSSARQYRPPDRKDTIPGDDDGLVVSKMKPIVIQSMNKTFQALNNLQSTFQGFGHVNSENVFKVCDEPHPVLIKDMLQHCVNGNIDEAYKTMAHLWRLGYSPEDIITIVFRVCKNHSMPEFLKLEFIKEIGYTHMRIAEGVNSLLQMAAMLARLCKKSGTPSLIS